MSKWLKILYLSPSSEPCHLKVRISEHSQLEQSVELSVRYVEHTHMIRIVQFDKFSYLNIMNMSAPLCFSEFFVFF